MSANKHPLIIELLHDKVLRSNLIGCIIIWSMCAFNFYLLTFFMKYFPGSIYKNSFSFALSDMVAFTLSGFIVKRMSVHNGYKIAFLTSTVGGVLFVLFTSVQNLVFSSITMTAFVLVLVCLCRMGVTMAFNIGYTSVPRLFPIKFQSTVYAVVNLFAHIVACAAPLVAEIPSPLPFAAFVIAIVISASSLKFLKEIDRLFRGEVKEQDLEQNYYEVQENSGISRDEIHP